MEKLLPAIIGFTGVIVGGVLAVVKDWYIGKLNKNRDAKYLAVRVVCMLDAFIEPGQ